MESLIARQRSEREYHEQWARGAALPDTVDLSTVSGAERRPWNSYWEHFRVVREFRNTACEQRLLDFGCGCGVASLRYAAIGYRVSGFDLSEPLVQHARKLAEKYSLQSRVDFSVQTAEVLAYDDQMFDVVAGVDILHHVDVPASVREVSRVLRPGGLAVFREPVRAPIVDWLRDSWPARKLFPAGPSFEHYRTPEERKLTRGDLRSIRRVFSDVDARRYRLFSRLEGKLLPKPRPGRPSRIEMVDWFLFKCLPFMGALGGDILIIMRK